MHLSQNLTNIVKKEECNVTTFFTLLKDNNISYVDFLKIDTEGHDCAIMNNFLDELPFNFCLPRYLLFENNGLTSKEIRENTLYRLYQYGYVHIFTEDDNSFLYNCKTHFDLVKREQGYVYDLENIQLDTFLSKKHYFMNVHSYVTAQIFLFSNILSVTVVNDPSDADIIWSTQEVSDYIKWSTTYPTKLILNTVHGGDASINIANKCHIKPNMILKSVNECANSAISSTFFIGKYEQYFSLFSNLYVQREKKTYTTNNFVMLNGFFKFNCDFDLLKKV